MQKSMSENWENEIAVKLAYYEQDKTMIDPLHQERRVVIQMEKIESVFKYVKHILEWFAF